MGRPCPSLGSSHRIRGARDARGGATGQALLAGTEERGPQLPGCTCGSPSSLGGAGQGRGALPSWGRILVVVRKLLTSGHFLFLPPPTPEVAGEGQEGSSRVVVIQGRKRHGPRGVAGTSTWGLHFFRGTFQSEGSFGVWEVRPSLWTPHVFWPQAQLHLSSQGALWGRHSLGGSPSLVPSCPLFLFGVTLRTAGSGRCHPRKCKFAFVVNEAFPFHSFLEHLLVLGQVTYRALDLQRGTRNRGSFLGVHGQAESRLVHRK